MHIKRFKTDLFLNDRFYQDIIYIIIVNAFYFITIFNTYIKKTVIVYSLTNILEDKWRYYIGYIETVVVFLARNVWIQDNTIWYEKYNNNNLKKKSRMFNKIYYFQYVNKTVYAYYWRYRNNYSVE